ncbi:MAG TPA: hypothetical protein VID48_04320 [Solirubrobacteraceae bacterium]
MATSGESESWAHSRMGFSRYSLAGALLAVGVLGALAALVFSGSGHSSGPKHPRTSQQATATADSSAGPGQTGGAVTKHHPRLSPTPAPIVSGVEQSGGQTVATELPDPEESKSFPVSPSVHHKQAETPTKAADEAIVAPGALSEAQVRRELHEEEHARAQERVTRQRELIPQKGGFSVGGDGTIPIPSGIPEAVQRVIAGGNAITDFPYIWGGGHASFIANGYDCSGSVSYALAAGGLLDAPLVSGQLAKWGAPGPGKWITIYANGGHTFMEVDGVWFDTAGRSGPYASRWLVSQPELAGYAVRHPQGF